MRNAFTLIELLIVVAIIAILAAIAVPNFLEAQMRAKVSRCNADMRTIATGLESYRVDNNNYPTDPGAGFVDPSGRSGYSSFLGLRPLSTPIAYITSTPKDPFIRSNINWPETYVYYCPDNKPLAYGPFAERSVWQLQSPGPNQVYDWNFLRYDATNGTVSAGDIFFWGPGIGMAK